MEQEKVWEILYKKDGIVVYNSIPMVECTNSFVLKMVTFSGTPTFYNHYYGTYPTKYAFARGTNGYVVLRATRTDRPNSTTYAVVEVDTFMNFVLSKLIDPKVKSVPYSDTYNCGFGAGTALFQEYGIRYSVAQQAFVRIKPKSIKTSLYDKRAFLAARDGMLKSGIFSLGAKFNITNLSAKTHSDKDANNVAVMLKNHFKDPNEFRSLKWDHTSSAWTYTGSLDTIVKQIGASEDMAPARSQLKQDLMDWWNNVKEIVTT